MACLGGLYTAAMFSSPVSSWRAILVACTCSCLFSSRILCLTFCQMIIAVPPSVRAALFSVPNICDFVSFSIIARLICCISLEGWRFRTTTRKLLS